MWIGWHNTSDDSVNSAYLTDTEVGERVIELMKTPEVDHIWLRNQGREIEASWVRDQ